MVYSPKHVAPIIDYDNSDWDDVPMPVTYVSDHDWEKYSYRGNLETVAMGWLNEGA
jgi:hypothetical protein